MSVLYHPEKAYVFVDALSCMTMGSVSHLDEAKNDLSRKVHMLYRLGVRLECSPDKSAIVHCNFESSLVVGGEVETTP